MKSLTARLVAACLALLLGMSVAFAQTATLDYSAWEALATRAETAIEDERASDTVFEELRTEIAGWRDTFSQGQSTNAARIKTLQAQLDALGTPPEEGEEAPEIAARRTELEEQLGRLRAPGLQAEEAYTRANGLIGEIDTLIRNRQADRLLELGPSPLNPANWAGAAEQLFRGLASFNSEIVASVTSPSQQASLRANLPVVLVLLVVAVVLLVKGHAWIRSAVSILRRKSGRGAGVWQFVVSLGQILVPALGIYALTLAAFATGMPALRGTLFLEALPLWALTLLGVRWLTEQTFSRDDGNATIKLAPARRLEARFYANALSVVLVVRSAVDLLAGVENFAEETVAVLRFPIVVVAGLLLFRLAHILTAANLSFDDEEEDGSSGFRTGLLHVLAKGAMILAILGPAMSAVGYSGAGEGLVIPAMATLAIFAGLLVLQRFIDDLYMLAVGQSATERNSLIPVLAGFLLVLGVLPVLALVWGARVADLTELWTRFREGFVVGGTQISPTDFLLVLVVFAIGYGLTRLLQGGLRNTVLPKTKLDVGGRNAVISGVGYVGVFISAIIAITAAGLDLSSLAIVAGALSVGIGFGLQNIVSNFVSGIILLIERPISEGDWIAVGDQMGFVKAISVRSTRIETFDRTDVIVPNADLVSGTVTNYTRGNSIGRVIVPVGVAYGSDTKQVETILRNIAREHPNILMNPEPQIFFTGFGADSMDFEIRAILSDVTTIMHVRSDMNHAIAAKFAEEGIEIPFAQRDVWLRNPEALHPPATTNRTAEPSPEVKDAPEDAEGESSD